MLSLERLFNRADRVPKWLRPSAVGVAFVVAVGISRGAMVIVPLLVVATLIWSPTPVAHLLAFAAVYVVALVGAAVGGLAYHFVGRHLLRVPYVGTFLAAIVTVVPYAYSLLPFVRLKDVPLSFSRPTPDEHVAALGLAAFVATAFTCGWYREKRSGGDGDGAA